MKKILIVLIVLCFSCGNNVVTDSKTISTSLTYKEYVIVLKTIISPSNINIKWEEYGFVYPYILSQEIIMYKNGRQYYKHIIPIPKRKFVVNGKKYLYQTIPIYDIEILNDSNGVGVHLYGSNYCCGELCPEYNGFFLLDGTIVSECISSEEQPLNGKNPKEVDFDMNSSLTKKTILPMFITI